MKLYINVIAPKFLDWVEYFSPLGKGGDGKVGIANMTIGPIIFSVKPMSPGSENHEVIHVHQYLEVGLVGLLLTLVPLIAFGAPWWAFLITVIYSWFPGISWFYVVYGLTYAYWMARLKLSPGEWTGFDAYTLIPFEREAYLYDQDLDYLPTRKWFAWWNIGTQEASSDQRTRGKHVLATIFTLKEEGE
jgi:hypothetical protein